MPRQLLEAALALAQADEAGAPREVRQRLAKAVVDAVVITNAQGLLTGALERIDGGILGEHERFWAVLHGGGALDCRVCERAAHVQRRTLTYGMARMLILIYEYVLRNDPPDGWVHINRELVLTPEMGQTRTEAGWKREPQKLRYPQWGILELRPKTPDVEGATSGYYRITERGYEFLFNRLRVPRTLFHVEPGYGDLCLVQHANETTNIVEALSTYFDYAELMEPLRRSDLQ